jgi:hypothetical protein
LCLACSSQRIAREVGVHIRTSYRWCWWLRNAALSYEMQRQLDSTVEGSVAKFVLGQNSKIGIRNSTAYRLPNTRKSNFATEPKCVLDISRKRNAQYAHFSHCKSLGYKA